MATDGNRWLQMATDGRQMTTDGRQMATDGDSWRQLAATAGERVGGKRKEVARLFLFWDGDLKPKRCG